MKRLIHEIHRRSLWQVLGIYVAGSWAALEIIDYLAANVGLPPWFPTLALALMVLGLPVVLATAFVQEGGPREDRTPAGAGAEPVPAPAHHRLFTWRNAVLGGVAAFALWGVVAAGWLAFRRTPPVADGATAMRSIAVLPFATRSDDRQDQYFAEGMHDDLLTQLAKIDSLTVISRTSVMQYANTTKSVRDIGQELGVAAVLEGGVQRAGDHVRVNVQLIDAASDRHLWAETYDEQLTAANLFAIQSDLARKIAGALRATLTPSVDRRLEERPTESLEAYDLFTRARYVYFNRGAFGEDLEEARSLYEQAVAADSAFAGAWAGLAHTYLAFWNWGRMPQEAARPRVQSALDRALALDPENVDALIAQARLLQFDGRLEEAERVALRAIELGPGNAEAHNRYALLLGSMGRYDESVEVGRRAIQLDPLAVAYRHALADRLFFAGRFDEAAEESRKALEMAPRDWYGYYNLGWAHAAVGRAAPAIDAFHQALRHTTESEQSVRMGLAYAFARGGQRDSAMAQLAGFDAAEAGYDYALVLYELGDAEDAFRALEAALREQPVQLARIRGDPTARRMVADARFSALLSRLGLE